MRTMLANLASYPPYFVLNKQQAGKWKECRRKGEEVTDVFNERLEHLMALQNRFALWCVSVCVASLGYLDYQKNCSYWKQKINKFMMNFFDNRAPSSLKTEDTNQDGFYVWRLDLWKKVSLLWRIAQICGQDFTCEERALQSVFWNLGLPTLMRPQKKPTLLECSSIQAWCLR